MYVNGQVCSSIKTNDLKIKKGNYILLGNIPKSDHHYLKGEIDDICLYNRSLTNEEIKSLTSVGGYQPAPVTSNQNTQYKNNTGSSGTEKIIGTAVVGILIFKLGQWLFSDSNSNTQINNNPSSQGDSKQYNAKTEYNTDCTFRLVSLTCEQQNSTYVNDKIYFKMSGYRKGVIREPSSNRENPLMFRSGTVFNFNQEAIDISKNDYLEVEVWDRNMIGSDNFLGKSKIDCSLGRGLSTLYYNAGSSYLTLNGGIKEGAIYKLVVEVL